MAKNLLIVESPAKAKTINKYLGKDFHVLASYGHVRDLVPKEGAVDTEHDFAMNYTLIEKNERHVEAIAKAAKQATGLFLATDPDREGEAISWHIAEILRERGLLEGRTLQRVVFTEITPRAIKEAMSRPRDVSTDLVNAQQARRALDYLVGFNLSPVLWRKVQRGLSAGRVQSPALRMIAEREEEIEAFIAREYWTIESQLAHPAQPFNARLVKLDGKKFEQFDLTNETDAQAARSRLEQAAGGKLVVADVQSKERRRKPAPPFITSTLQQEAARKLGFSTSRTMRIAQKLYEGISLGDEGTVGLISYMRTDSTHISEEAVAELRETIVREFGPQALPAQANEYRTKSKNAQEAHEAIRPTSALRTPRQMAPHLDPDAARLYELIWKRTVACQMVPALMNTVSIELAAGETHRFRASGTTIIDPGFLAVYEEGKDTKTAEDDDQGRKLPPMRVGEVIPLAAIVADQHFTEPPPRFSEASLVKTLEEHGIGRPSTYASIIQTLLNREYVLLDNRRFRPTDVGRAVSRFLTGHFTRYVDYDFTAKLEDELDAVSRGEQEWVPLLERFWQPFKILVDEKSESVDRNEATGARALGTDPASGKPLSVRLGRYGAYAQIGTADDEDKPRFASLRPGQSMHTISAADALELFKLPRTLGEDAGEPVTVAVGRFGPFAKRGTTYASLKKEDDPYTIDFDTALLRIREKEEAAANRIIKAFEGSDLLVVNGRYGPYVTDGVKNGRIPKEREPESLTLGDCQAIMASAPDRPARGRGAAKKAAAKKAASKKTSARKAAINGAAAADDKVVVKKKPAAKKAARKKSTVGKATAGKATTKKAAAKKTAAKKASAGKTADAIKRAASKTAAGKPAANA
jgi:DNA topoisomerase I